MSMYKDEMTKLFQEEKNILLGTEEIDRITSSDYNGEEIMADLMSLLKPSESSVMTYEVTVVIGYSSPRVDHLLSLWNEVANPNDKGIYEFTRDPNSIVHLHTIDPLSLADKFLKRGVKVILIDVAGRQLTRVNSHKALACDIMLETCDSDGYPTFLDAHRKAHPEVLNALSVDPVNQTESNDGLRKKSGLTEKQMNEIDKEMRRYDCNYQHVLDQ